VGAFTADVSNLSRIVTLHNLNVVVPTGKDASGNLAMEATARTYRYLDTNEVNEQKRSAAKAAGAKK
jgi:type IV pilus assembly protein PilO